MHGRTLRLPSSSQAHNQLRELPDTLGELRALTALHLEGNLLGGLPAQIGGLRQLVTLRVADNKMERLPETFSLLTSLGGTLDLSRNPLRSLPVSFGNLNGLAKVVLDRTRITTLPASFSNLRISTLYGSAAFAIRMIFPFCCRVGVPALDTGTRWVALAAVRTHGLWIFRPQVYRGHVCLSG